MTHLYLFSLFFLSGTENLDELVSAVVQRTGAAKDNDRPQILVKFSSYFSYLLFILLKNFLVYFSNLFYFPPV